MDRVYSLERWEGATPLPMPTPSFTATAGAKALDLREWEGVVPGVPLGDWPREDRLGAAAVTGEGMGGCGGPLAQADFVVSGGAEGFGADAIDGLLISVGRIVEVDVV